MSDQTTSGNRWGPTDGDTALVAAATFVVGGAAVFAVGHGVAGDGSSGQQDQDGTGTSA